MRERRRDGAAKDFQSAFGDTLKAFREGKETSQRSLASRSGVDHGTVSRLESGGREPLLRTAVELVGALGLSDAESLLLLRSGVLGRDQD